MIVQKQANTHKHTLHKAYKGDAYIDGIRYILLWVCTSPSCEYKTAYDFVYEKPGVDK